MFEFTIQGTHFKIENSDIDDVVACYKADAVGNWSWIVFENTDRVSRGDDTVDFFLNNFLDRVNKKLAELFGSVEPPSEFKTPMEELVFRINNELKLVDGKIIIQS